MKKCKCDECKCNKKETKLSKDRIFVITVVVMLALGIAVTILLYLNEK